MLTSKKAKSTRSESSRVTKGDVLVAVSDAVLGHYYPVAKGADDWDFISPHESFLCLERLHKEDEWYRILALKDDGVLVVLVFPSLREFTIVKGT